ncbi:hypothetical protein [Billgrantia endophytica]|uniref:hypothetical protein n=1 Tax=Billgrantia endophytica TaxID=2033802 RepID=UPI0013FD3FD0|nr:hypothetical protein [Halomonas endophytica]
MIERDSSMAEEDYQLITQLAQNRKETKYVSCYLNVALGKKEKKVGDWGVTS